MDESLVKHLERPKEPAKLKVSEAIRIGAKLRPQCFDSYVEFDANDYGLALRSCAIGAALEAVTGHPDPGARIAWEVLDMPEELHDQVVDLNDEKRWSRERIADWLERKGY